MNVAFVFDTTTFEGGLYVDKVSGTFGTVNFIIKPLGSSVWDFFLSIFGKSKEKIIYGVPEEDGYVFVPAAKTSWNIDTYLILKTSSRHNLLEQILEKHYSEIYEKMKAMEEQREIEKKAFETYRREKMKMKVEEIIEILKMLSPEEKKRFREKFAELGIGGD